MLSFYFSYILPQNTDWRPRDDREKSGITFAWFFAQIFCIIQKKVVPLHGKGPWVIVDFIAERIIATQMDLLRLLADGGVNGGASSKSGGVNLEELIFETIQKNPGINAPAIADILQKSLRTTQRYLKSLSDSNRIAFRGAPKNGGYHVL